jgi:hypothetical protein
MVSGAGIVIAPKGLTTSTKDYFDSRESGIEYAGKVSCLADATTTMPTYER